MLAVTAKFQKRAETSFKACLGGGATLQVAIKGRQENHGKSVLTVNRDSLLQINDLKLRKQKSEGSIKSINSA